MPTLWKQQVDLHATFARHNRCLEEDWFLLPYELKLQRAHVKALAGAKILTAKEASKLSGAFDTIAEGRKVDVCPESTAEDIHTWIETEVVALVGDVGKKLHTARSRNDQVATLLKLYLIDAGERSARDIRNLVRILCRRANEWSELVAPMQTHAQFAAPGTMGFWALRYAVAFQRAGQQVQDCTARWRRYSPLGSGAVAGSSIPIEREIQAAEMGFEAPSLNALDSTSTRDECLQFVSCATQSALHFQSFATDVIAFAQTPFSWVKYPRAFGTGSSMMPNKANPDAMELMRGMCCSIHSAHLELILLLKGLPSGYNRDLQCCKPLVHQTADRLSSMCAMTAAFVEELDFDREQLQRSLSLGRIGATLSMEQQVMSGTALRDAHHAVAASSDADEFGADVARYRTSGSANPAETRRIAGLLLAGLEAEA